VGIDANDQAALPQYIADGERESEILHIHPRFTQPVRGSRGLWC